MKGNGGIEGFEAFSSTLTGTLETGPVAERLLQLVFFHPMGTFRDGGGEELINSEIDLGLCW
jgi:hypothetical protein